MGCAGPFVPRIMPADGMIAPEDANRMACYLPRAAESATVAGRCRRERTRADRTIKSDIMHLTPKEIDKLMLLSLGMIAEKRMKKGLKLNYPEAVAYITSTALEGAREGKTVEEVMKNAASVLKKSDVMEGVAEMIDLLQVEAVFTDGSRLVSIHHPIK